MDIVDIIINKIESSQGTSVANQFESSWTDSDFEGANENALALILNELDLVLNCYAIVEDVKHEVREYKTDLESFLNS